MELTPILDSVAAMRLRLGEPGGGQLGISGPGWSTFKADKLLYGLVDRIDRIEWVFAYPGHYSLDVL